MNASATNPLEPRDLPAAVIAVCGWSGSGKTTLLETVIPMLTAKGLRVAAIKHCGHDVEVDRAGKDSDRLFCSGADVALGMPSETMWRDHRGPADEVRTVIARLAEQHDVVLVEGHKSMAMPKVWLAHPDDATRPSGVDGVVAELPWNGDRAGPLRSAIERQLGEQWSRRPLYAGVLIGGASTRMGSPKASLRFGETTFVDRVLSAARPRVTHLSLIGNATLPSLQPAVDRIPDAPGLSGPLAGMLAAMRWAPQACWLFIACDMPMLEPQAIDWLIGRRAPGRWAVLPEVKAGRVEPLLALYEPQARGLLESLAVRGLTSPRLLAGQASVDTPQVPAHLASSWINVNTPEDLSQLRAKIGAGDV